ncbi:hypothetical protein CAMGR0001_0366 [Campylobacter gracilis RM3268]|uniref:Uncharacterized protein n=1 Tax=Campylobacter gracilis RM3268 TaxID=553220 RepID=C8PHC2_9BACT|nr:hypothetical protein CAMGR0001_0366 [Campylobacter gracilis RM3268]
MFVLYSYEGNGSCFQSSGLARFACALKSADSLRDCLHKFYILKVVEFYISRNSALHILLIWLG